MKKKLLFNTNKKLNTKNKLGVSSEFYEFFILLEDFEY